MCIIIANRKGKMTKETLENCWNGNGDGAGLAYSDKGTLMIYKELSSFERFWGVYSKSFDEHGTDTDFLLHFRISTGGGVTTDNVHPFDVGDELLMAHNGTFHSKYKPTKTESDTNLLCQRLTANGVNMALLETELFQSLLSEHIGSSNKLVFIDLDGNTTIINDDAYRAEYDDAGNWYSNDSYKGQKRYAGNKEVTDYSQRWNQWGDSWGDSWGDRKHTEKIKAKSPHTVNKGGNSTFVRSLSLATMNDKSWAKVYPQMRFCKYNASTGIFVPCRPELVKANGEFVYDNAAMGYITIKEAKAIITNLESIAAQDMKDEAARQLAEQDVTEANSLRGVYDIDAYGCVGCFSNLTNDEIANGEGLCINCLIAAEATNTNN